MNEELKTRRDFFKKAAQTALPILGAIVLASNPVMAKGLPVTSCTRSCVGGCSGCSGCTSNCKEGCSSCGGGCANSCVGHCRFVSK